MCCNPGLLGIRQEQADGAEACMAFSYVIAATRPLPKIIGAALLFGKFDSWFALAELLCASAREILLSPEINAIMYDEEQA